MSVSSHQQIQILHVDDDPDFAELTGTVLERKDDRFTVETATDAEDGLQRITDRPPDCVVSDYNMPGMDGIEFLRAVKEEFPDLPFILFTGKGSEAVASDAVSAGVTDYLQKGTGTSHYTVLANRISNVVEATRSAAKAEQRRHRLEQILKTVPGCVVQLDADGQFVFANDRAEAVLGLETDEVTRRAYNAPEWELETLTGEPIQDEELPFRQVRDAGEPISDAKHTVTWPDGSRKILSVNAAPLFDETGDVESVVASLNDITDRRDRQRELRLLQQAIDDANVPITLADPSQPDEPLVYVNDAFEEMTGYPPEETLGRNCRFLQGEDTDPEKAAALRETIDNEEATSVELCNYRKDGTKFWNRLTVTPIYDDNDDLVRYLGTQENVTAQKERERELESKRRFIEQSLDVLDDLFYVIDTDGTLRRWNAKAPEVTGYSESELDGMPAIELVPEDDRETATESIETALSDGADMIETDLLTADGHRIPYEFTGARLADEDGNTAGLVGIGRDVTGGRERTYRELAEEYEALLETSGDAIFMLDVDTAGEDPAFEFTRLSPGYETQTGISTEEVRGKTPQAVFGEERGAELEANYTRCLEQRGPVSYREELEVADDARFWETSLAPVIIDTEVIRIVGIARNVTAQVERERELQRQNERLDEFASIVSHDLRSPLTVAAGTLELARKTCESTHLVKTREAIARSQALIDDLLRLAREGHEVAEVEPVALGAVAENSWQTAETKRATLETDVSQIIHADESRLQQLFENLYRNAIDHGRDDVTVWVDAMDDGFSVADTGPGIPESDREEIFEAGYSTSGEGTGFGLRIVQQIADAHGWDITVTDSEQGGARFDITGVEFVDSV